MINKQEFLQGLKDEINENNLFYSLFHKALELQPKKEEINEKHYYFILSTLESFNEYLNYTSILYDIEKIINKRFNDEITKENILKSIDILIIKE